MLAAQLYPTPCNSTYYSPSRSSVHEMLPAKITLMMKKVKQQHQLRRNTAVHTQTRLIQADTCTTAESEMQAHRASPAPAMPSEGLTFRKAMADERDMATVSREKSAGKQRGNLAQWSHWLAVQNLLTVSMWAANLPHPSGGS